MRTPASSAASFAALSPRLPVSAMRTLNERSVSRRLALTLLEALIDAGRFDLIRQDATAIAHREDGHALPLLHAAAKAGALGVLKRLTGPKTEPVTPWPRPAGDIRITALHHELHQLLRLINQHEAEFQHACEDPAGDCSCCCYVLPLAVLMMMSAPGVQAQASRSRRAACGGQARVCGAWPRSSR